jgi:hypothetical protein
MNGSASGGWECRCEAGWYGEDCSVPIELNCSDKTDNDGGKSFNLQQRIIFSSILDFEGASPKIAICEAPGDLKLACTISRIFACLLSCVFSSYRFKDFFYYEEIIVVR